MSRPRPIISKVLYVALACSLLAIANVAPARNGFRAGDVVILHPWSRATPRGATVGAGYFVVENHATIPDRLLGGSVDVAAGFEIHDVVVKDGVMRMRQLNALEISTKWFGRGETWRTSPHTFVGLLHPLAAGEKVRGALQFERAGRIEIEFDVIGMGAPAPGGEGN